MHQIMRPRGAQQIVTVFNELTQSLQPQIDVEQEARERLLISVDEDVVQLLRTRKDAITRVLSSFEKRLVRLPDRVAGLALLTQCDAARASNTRVRPGRQAGLSRRRKLDVLPLSDGNLATTLVEQAKRAPACKNRNV